jgi:putative membrane protein
VTDGSPWLRLDARMLLVHPLDELRKFIVPLVAAAVFGASQGGGPFVGLVAVLVPLVLGVVRYLTTSYRIAEGRVELRRGLLNRQRLSTPVDRVRTVDLTASLLHRVVGLTTVRIGTGGAGNDDGDLTLDGLTVEQGRALRALLLAEQRPTEEAAAEEPPPVARFEPAWLRFAPFTSAGLAILGGLAGAGAQVMSELDIRVDLDAEDLAGRATAVVAGGVIGLAVLVLVLTLLGYLVTNWRFTLRRDADTWHVSRGLLTTRETSIDVDRLAGVSIAEPPGLRLARGARLSAIVTGLGSIRSGSQVLVPPAPDEVVRRAGGAVLGSEEPLRARLTTHGATAVRRRWTRALLPASLAAAVPALLVAAGLPPWVLVLSALALLVGCALAVDRVRSLGHAVVAGHFVARSGSLLRSRDALAVDHVIGWNLRDTWFQRRAGLTTLAATTAGGSGKVEALDVPTGRAVEVAAQVTPEPVGQFAR